MRSTTPDLLWIFMSIKKLWVRWQLLLPRKCATKLLDLSLIWWKEFKEAQFVESLLNFRRKNVNEDLTTFQRYNIYTLFFSIYFNLENIIRNLPLNKKLFTLMLILVICLKQWTSKIYPAFLSSTVVTLLLPVLKIPI